MCSSPSHDHTWWQSRNNWNSEKSRDYDSRWNNSESEEWQGSPSSYSDLAYNKQCLTPDEILSVLRENGVRDIYIDLFGDWAGAWSGFGEGKWLYSDRSHFNTLGQEELRYRFQSWLQQEEQRSGKFDVLIADSIFYTHDDNWPHGRMELDEADLRSMGFSVVYAKCGVGFVRNIGYAQMISSAISDGDLEIPRGSRVLLVTSGNDLWCCPETQPLYSAGYLASHINWAREVLQAYTPHVHFVSIIDERFDYMAYD